MPPKKKQSKDILHITTTGEKLGNLIKLVKRYSDGMGESSWQFKKKGIFVQSIDAAFTSMIEVSAGKGFFEKYTLTEELKMNLENSDLEKLREICRAAEEQEMTLRISEKKNKFLIKYGNVNRSMQIPINEEATLPKAGTLEGIYNGSQVLGTIKTADLDLFMKASANWQGERERVSTFQKKGKKEALEICTTLEENVDEVVLNLTKEMEVEFKGDTLKIMLLSKMLNTAIKQMKPLTDQLVLKGNTDYPMLIMPKDVDPEDALDFEEDIMWWYMIAPRVEED